MGITASTQVGLWKPRSEGNDVFPAGWVRALTPARDSPLSRAMDISHFELTFKPQAPAEPADIAAVDALIQGYFLNITNLEDKEYQYRMKYE